MGEEVNPFYEPPQSVPRSSRKKIAFIGPRERILSR
jgi:hypothetical protein